MKSYILNSLYFSYLTSEHFRPSDLEVRISATSLKYLFLIDKVIQITDAFIITLNPKRDDIRSQNTKISKDVYGIALDVAEREAHLDVILKVQVKLEGCYKVVSKQEFEQMKELLSQLYDGVRKIEVSLKIDGNSLKKMV